MKIVITVTSPTFDSEVDPRFGRGAYLLVVDLDKLEWVAQSNPGVTASGGAGIATAQFVMVWGLTPSSAAISVRTL